MDYPPLPEFTTVLTEYEEDILHTLAEIAGWAEADEEINARELGQMARDCLNRWKPVIVFPK